MDDDDDCQARIVRSDTHKESTLSVHCTHETYIVAGPDGNMWFICY